MKSLSVEFYEVYESYDRDYNVIARFTNYADAMRLADTSVYYGCSELPKKSEINVYESYDEYLAWKADSVRRNALAKLTAAERIALGLD